jgi:hypothetical protein
MDPTPVINMGDQDADHPQEYEGDVSAPNNQTKLEFDPGAESRCGPGGAPAETNPCAFVDYVNLSQVTDQKIHYHARNHGGRCVITLLIYARNREKNREIGSNQDWVVGASFMVFVPVDAVDATVVGKMGSNDIFFTPKSPLSEEAAKRFSLIDSKTVDGVGTYYTFRLVNPFPD